MKCCFFFSWDCNAVTLILAKVKSRRYEINLKAKFFLLLRLIATLSVWLNDKGSADPSLELGSRLTNAL